MSSKGPNFGNGRIDAVEVKRLDIFENTPTLALSWDPLAVRGETQNTVRTDATVKYVASTKTLTVTVGTEDFTGTAGSDITYVITGYTGKIGWSSNSARASTLKDVMDLLNELPGITAEVLNAPYSLSFNSTTNFSDITEVNIPLGTIDGRLETLKGAAGTTAYLRVGLPECFDAAALYLIDVSGIVTGTSSVDGTLKVYRDNYDEYGQDAEVYEEKSLSSSQTDYLGYDVLTAPTVRGSLIVEVSNTDALTVANLNVKFKRASLGAA